MKKSREIKHYTESMLYEMKLTTRAIQMYAKHVFNKLNIDLAPEEIAALDIIQCNPGIIQRDVAKLLLTDRANTGKVLNTLEERGYLSRKLDSKNNRMVKKCFITEEGNEFLKHSTELVLKSSEEVAPFPEEIIANIKEALYTLRMNIESRIEQKI